MDRGDLFGVAGEDLEGRLDLERETLASATDGPFAWIAPDRLAVLELSRIGRALIERVAATAKEAGSSRLYWTTQESNAAGRACTPM